ncbi:hypothetical protein K3495_g3953 [Podosphaera aphanis]|nr:hypothetical protein K3495_g3953 [Podosphaera aphanis]
MTGAQFIEELFEDYLSDRIFTDEPLSAPIILNLGSRTMPTTRARKRPTATNPNSMVPLTPSKRLVNPDHDEQREEIAIDTEMEVYTAPHEVPPADAVSQHSSRMVQELSESLDKLMNAVNERIHRLESAVSSLLKSHNCFSTEVTRLLSEIRSESRSLESSNRGELLSSQHRKSLEVIRMIQQWQSYNLQYLWTLPPLIKESHAFWWAQSSAMTLDSTSTFTLRKGHKLVRCHVWS